MIVRSAVALTDGALPAGDPAVDDPAADEPAFDEPEGALAPAAAEPAAAGVLEPVLAAAGAPPLVALSAQPARASEPTVVSTAILFHRGNIIVSFRIQTGGRDWSGRVGGTGRDG